MDQQWGEALTLARSPNTTMRSKSLRTAWLNSVAAVSNKPHGGLNRHIIGVRASVSLFFMNLAQDFLRFVSKLDLKLQFPELLQSGLVSQTWWSACYCLIALLVPHREPEVCLHCSTKWAVVSDELGRCCVSSRIGQKLFSFDLTMAAQEWVAAFATAKTTLETFTEFSEAIVALEVKKLEAIFRIAAEGPDHHDIQLL